MLQVEELILEKIYQYSKKGILIWVLKILYAPETAPFSPYKTFSACDSFVTIIMRTSTSVSNNK